MHASERIVNSRNKVLSMKSGTMPKESVILGLAMIVKNVTHTLLRMSNDVTLIERDPHRHQVKLEAFDGETGPDLFFQQPDSLSYPHFLRTLQSAIRLHHADAEFLELGV